MGLRTSIRDITDKKQIEKEIALNEERLNLVLNSLRDGVWDWYIQTGEVYFSERYYTMIGYAPYELPQSFETWTRLVHPEDIGSSMDIVEHALVTGEPFEMEFRMKTKDGHWRWILGRGRTIEKADDGRPLRMLGTHMDVTNRKMLESTIRQSQKLEAMGVLAGGIAHDFNNILAGIIGYAELVMDDVAQESKNFDRLTGIINSSERAREVIAQILTFSRKGEKEYQTIDVRIIIKETITLIRASLPATIEIKQQINTNLPNIFGDPTQIHQILMNLSTNAFHAMPQEGVLEISCEEIESSADFIQKFPSAKMGKYVCLRVKDNGTGIDPDVQSKIFDPFFTTKEKGSGTGLGLSVVHGIVSDHGGIIDIESHVGEGTDVHVYFPAIETAVDEDGHKATTQMTGSESILLVDDEEVLSLVVSEMLENMGYSVISVTDGKAALDMFKAAPDRFDLVLSDITMPYLTGIELVQKLHQIRPEMPVILWSGDHANIPEEILGKDANVSFLKKPFLQSELSVAIKEAVQFKA